MWDILGNFTLIIIFVGGGTMAVVFCYLLGTTPSEPRFDRRGKVKEIKLKGGISLLSWNQKGYCSKRKRRFLSRLIVHFGYKPATLEALRYSREELKKLFEQGVYRIYDVDNCRCLTTVRGEIKSESSFRMDGWFITQPM